MAHYLVTGAAGFIGSHLVTAVLKEGHRVTGLDNLSTGRMSNIECVTDGPHADQYKFINGDIRDYDQCQSACHDVDYVLHQAALGSVPRSIREPKLYHDNNVTGTVNMLLAARAAHVKCFVFASSSSSYGDTPVLPKVETMPPRPKSPYAVSKVVGEYYCRIFWDVYKMPTIAFRYFNVFGPRQAPNSQYAAVVPAFVVSCLGGVPPIIHGDGTQTRDFTFIDNVVQANLYACRASERAYGSVYNVGCGQQISIKRLADIIRSYTGCIADVQYESARDGDVKDSLADIQLFQQHIYSGKFIHLDDGLKQTVEWYLGTKTS